MEISYSTSRLLKHVVTFFSIKQDFHKNGRNFRQPETEMDSHFIQNVLHLGLNFYEYGLDACWVQW